MIKSIKAKQILNSRGKATVEVRLKTDKGVFRASVPSGVSTGKYEVKELSALKAVRNINEIIAPELIGKEETKQKQIDKLLSKRLGANAILAVSIALCRAGAGAKNLPLYKYIKFLRGPTSPEIFRRGRTSTDFPKTAVLLIEGGLHGKKMLAIQEFLLIGDFEKTGRIYRKLGKILNYPVGLEGGFAPSISNPKEALDLIMKASKGEKIKIGLDCAASHLKSKYNVDFYTDLVKKYPIILLEDPFSEDDWLNWQKITKKLGKKIIILGDDLLTTNIKRIKTAKQKKACNGTIIKPNQIGTITETLEAAKLAKSYGWKIMVSHRAGETMDDFIADLAVGLNADFLKSGAPFQKERLVKYNRLLKIKQEFKK